MRVVADQDIPYLRGVLEPFAEVVYRPGRAIAPADVADADALLVRTRTVCNAALLQHSRVRFIASATIGFDHIDTAYCAAHGIAWTNAPGCNASSVQQYMAAALMHVAEHRAMTLRGLTLGVVGVGHVGSRVAALGAALGMRVLCNDPPRERRERGAAWVSLDAVLREADIITLHVPLTDDGPDRTRQLFGAEVLGACAPHQLLFNTSRGEVVDGAALKRALRARALAGAVLDVWEGEPDINLALMTACDLATPHIAGYSADGKANGTAMAVRALARRFGLPLTDWAPPDVPPPAGPHLAVSDAASTAQQVVARAVRATYDVAADDARLRTDPTTFEQQRTAHPFRREFAQYTVKRDGLSDDVAQQLAAIGFALD